MIVSIDHGNKSIKTPRLLFTSGLVESTTKPGIQGDYIYWDGKYYSLTEKRISYLRDKTEDDRFYVLTLFAIAYEMRAAKKEEIMIPCGEQCDEPYGCWYKVYCRGLRNNN